MVLVLLDRIVNLWEARFDNEDSIEHFTPNALEDTIYARLRELNQYKNVRELFIETRKRVRADLRMLREKDESLYKKCLNDYYSFLRTGNLPKNLLINN
ncbi:hypothetical protein HYW74_03120 [Candidatus Pacearchaeota archaeon]|nr:hypothetical protein [Candidatus Pacearchaeota archaeon]